MKNILLLPILFLLACSNNQNTSTTPETPKEEIYNLDSNGIGFFSGSPQVENDPRIDLLTVVQGQKKTLAITIKNMGTTATALLSASLSDTKFYITSSTCSNKSLPPNGGSCSLTLNFSAVGKALQVFESTLQFGTSSIPVKIEVVTSSGQSGGGSALVKMYDGATQITSPPDYSIGSVSGTSKISKVITIKNEGTAATLIGDATLSSSSFYLTSNSCVGKALVSGASCSATVNFSGSGKTAGQSYSTTISFSGSSVSLSASTQAPPAPAPAQLVFMEGSNNLSQPLSLGSYSGNITLSKTLSVKNVGGSASSSISLQLLNNAAGYFTVSNSCSNIVLAPGASCSFNLRVSTSNKSAGLHSVQLKMDQTTQDVSFEKIGVVNNSINLNLSGPGSVILNVQPYATSQVLSFPSTQALSLTAFPYPHARASITGDCSASGEGSISCPPFYLDFNKTVNVTFSCLEGYTNSGTSCDAPTYSLSAVKSAGGAISGDVLGLMDVGTDSKLVNYTFSNSATTLLATPSEGYDFNSWGGDCSTSGSNPICVLPLDGNKGISASFTIRTYTLNYFTNNGALGGVSGPGPTTVHGTVVTITASPNSGNRFVKWNGGVCDQSTDPVCYFIATKNETMEAQFEVIPAPAGQPIEWLLSQQGSTIPNGSSGGLTFADIASWDNMAKSAHSFSGDFTLTYDLSTHGVGGPGNGDMMLGFIPGDTNFFPLSEGFNSLSQRNSRLIYLNQGGVSGVSPIGATWSQSFNSTATSNSSIIITIQRTGSTTTSQVNIDGAIYNGIISTTYTGLMTPVIATYNGINVTLNSATVVGTSVPSPTDTVTVFLNVPGEALMFINNDASHSGDNNHPYYIECSGYGAGNNNPGVNCSFVMERGSNVVIELQHSSFQPTGWVNCPFEVTAGTGPGQFFCSLANIPPEVGTIQLGATGNFDPCAAEPWVCEVMGCTDSQAQNYNPSATQDDGSCSYSQGCTDPAAINYDPSAMQEDGSCQYAATFNQIGTFAYSSGSGQPASCKAKGPFGQDQLMADLVVSGPFSEEQKAEIQTAACDYLINMGSTQTQFTGMNQCTIDDFSMFIQISNSVGISPFMLSNNLIFDFSQYNVVPLEGSGDCDMWLNFGNPSFEITGGGISLTDGSMYYPVEYNNNLYYGVKGNSAGEFFYLVKSNKIDTVSLISTDYKIYVNYTSPFLILQGKLFFQAKYQDETQFKLFYLDENDTVQEFLGQIPGYQYQGVRDNSIMRMTSNGNYILINRQLESTHVLKIADPTGPVVDIVNNINYDLYFGNEGEFIGNDYYAAEYNANDLLKYLKKIDLTNNVISSISDPSNTTTYGFNKLRTDLPMGKTNQNSKLWFLNTGVNQIVSYEPLTDSKQVYSLQGTGISWRIFNETTTYFSLYNGPTEHLYKISDAGLQYVGEEKINQGFISNSGDLVYSESSGTSHNVYKINYGQPKTLLYPNKIMYTGQQAYVSQNSRVSYPAPVYKNQIVVSMADMSTAPFNVTSNMKIVLMDLDSLLITDTVSVCSQEIGQSDMKFDFYNSKALDDGLFLSVRTCGSQDFQLYKYKEGVAP